MQVNALKHQILIGTLVEYMERLYQPICLMQNQYAQRQIIRPPVIIQHSHRAVDWLLIWSFMLREMPLMITLQIAMVHSNSVSPSSTPILPTTQNRNLPEILLTFLPYQRMQNWRLGWRKRTPASTKNNLNIRILIRCDGFRCILQIKFKRTSHCGLYQPMQNDHR